MIELVLLFGLVLLVLCFMLFLGIKVQRHVQAEQLVNGSMYDKTVQLLQDKHELHRFGIAQYLKRQYEGGLSFYLSFSTMGLLATTVLLLWPVLMNGGIKLLFVIFPILGVLFIIVSAVLAELASIQPTSGGLFHMALTYSGKTLASIVAPMQLIGQLALTILYSYCCTILLTIWLSGAIPFIQQSWVQYIIMAAMIAVQILVSCLHSSVLKWVQLFGLGIQIAGIVLLISCAIFIIYPLSYSPAYVVNFDNYILSPFRGNEALTPVSVGIVIVLLCKWFIGSEQATSSAEETINPRVRTPWSIFLANGYQFIFGFIMIFVLACIVVLVFIGNDQPLLQNWFTFLLQSAHLWGQLLLFIAIISSWMSGQSALSNASRTLFVLGRDRFIPFSEKLATISYTRQTPHFATIVAGILSLLLFAAVKWIGSERWLEQFVIMIVLLYAASCLLTIYFTKDQIKQKGVWHLGKWSLSFKWIAIGFLLLLLSVAGYLLSLPLLLGVIVILICSLIYVFYAQSQQKSTMISPESIKVVEGKLPLH